ncbi:MAG: AAA family ATPase [Candidatus Eisenbacteria bacterium]|uniref:AAA family ATPase n=1 Tax=Eiseniibacteriota bacterium TaxID=2212470 RepID=A0A956NF34_UNCEI|nr:AAA family ATPase [Candidatus Eisenbacteria bacterium]MCB9463859.1 AAA family ATPase [Candidatus Eisenbacteria bacterium]
MPTTDTKVYLIGGPPGAGKTTLGTALAIQLGITSLSIDDLNRAVAAVTTPESHPGLHVMRRTPSLAYFTESTVDQLIADATLQHEAVWPMVESVIRFHASGGSRIVIDGWYMRPSWVARLGLSNVRPLWIHPTEAVLREREARLPWYGESNEPKRMLENFLARSFWHNELIRRDAESHGMTVLEQPGGRSVADLCDQILA